ncbi:MAG: hypothetical protein GWP08_00250 [Nitrospiraceae bacterium]|nr:hypothetical protein [Nitrospiraceae bacterium]
MRRALMDCKGLSGVVLLAIAAIVIPSQVQAFEVTFPDVSLEQAIRTTIGKPSGPIEDTDLVGVGFTSLNATFRGIEDLTGLEYCTDLVEVYLYGNAIDDIAPLASLPALRDIYMWENQISDLSPLAGLLELRFLFFHDNKLVDLSPLSGHPALGAGDILNVTGNLINQEGLCTIIPALEALEVTVYSEGECGRLLVDVPDPNLKKQLLLFLGLSPLDDLYDVDLARLEAFDASDKGIENLKGLEACINLEMLLLGGNRISDLTALSGLGKITSLYLAGNRISDLTPIHELYGLSYLELQDNELTSLSGIENLGGMLALFLHDNQLDDAALEDLRLMRNLRRLTLSNNQIANIGIVDDFRELIELDIGGNMVSDITPVTNLTKVMRLGLWDNQISSLTPVQGMKDLVFVDASGNMVSDITSLTFLTDLAVVILGDNLITGLSPLAGLPDLTVLSLTNNKISDISALVANTGLGPTGSPLVQDRVDLRGNQLSQENLCFDIPSLIEREVLVEFDGTCDQHGQTYQLTTAVRGEGSVEPPAGTRAYSQGTEVTLTATPAEGWVFDRWEGDVTATDNPVVVTMDADKRATAVFLEAAGAYTLTVDVSGNGTTTPTGETDYSEGAEVLITAFPDDEWLFDHWEGDIDLAQAGLNPITLVMNADKTVTAFFVERGPLYPLTTSTIGGGDVQVDPVGENGEYTENTPVSIDAIPQLGWVFDRWEGDVPPGAANPFTIVMDGPKNVVAVFVEDGFDYTLATVVEGNGTIQPAAGFYRYFEGTPVPLSATPQSGWVFDHWKGNLTGEANPTSITMDGDKTITAVFAAAPVTYTLTIGNIIGGGGVNTVNPPPGAYVYAEGKQITLIATPAEGWVFDQWQGDLQGGANPTVITMDDDKNVQAVFRQIPFLGELSPAKGTILGGEAVDILGGRLAEATAVTFGGEAATIVGASDTVLEVLTPPHERGVVDVHVTTPMGDVVAVAGFMFVEPPGPPELGAITPSVGKAVGGEVLSVRGRNLALTRSITFGGVAAQILSAEETRLQVVAPPNAPGFVAVEVTTTTGVHRVEDAYQYLGVPTISALSPDEGHISGGDTVLVQGTALATAQSVEFNTAAATIVNVTDTEIEILTPAHTTAEWVDVTVTTLGGAVTAVDAFEYFEQRSTIVCSVRDSESLDPILDASVRLDPPGRVLTSSVDGLYTFTNVRPGDYTLTVSAQDYAPQTRNVTTVLGQQIAVTFLLESAIDEPGGICGQLFKRLDEKISEPSMPLSVEDSPLAKAAATASLAVRVTAEAAIDPESAWAVAEGGGWFASGGAWLAADAENDGWVVFEPGEPFAPGESVTLTVGAVTVDGDIIGPLSKDFLIAADKALDNVPELVEVDSIEALPEVIAAPQSSVYRVQPAGVFAEPLTLQLPVPAGVSADALDIYYYSETTSHQGWYPADNVVGWMAPESRRTVDVDGQTYIEIQVNHAGVMQLGQAIELALGNTVSIEIGAGGGRAMWLSLGTTLFALSFALGLIVRRNATRA